MRIFLAALPLLAVAACAPAPPRALSGLWSVGENACTAGRGLTFDAGVVTAHLADGPQPLLEGVRYEVRRDRAGLFVRIRHHLPASPGGVSAAGGVSIVDLRQDAQGWLRPVARRYEDEITGSARAPLRGFGFAEALTVRHCGRPWATADHRRLRGRGA